MMRQPYWQQQHLWPSQRQRMTMRGASISRTSVLFSAASVRAAVNTLTSLCCGPAEGALKCWTQSIPAHNVQVTVMRSGETGEISTADLLVGDVMLLSTGDILPADGLLFEGNDIRRAQASASSCKLERPPWIKASAAGHAAWCLSPQP